MFSKILHNYCCIEATLVEKVPNESNFNAPAYIVDIYCSYLVHVYAFLYSLF